MYIYYKESCNDALVNNQQDATTFSIINLFNSALQVSGDKFAHPQENFVTVYTAFGTMHWSAAVSVHCTKSCIHSQNELLRMGEFVARNMYGCFEKINKRLIKKNVCILLVVYIIVLVTHGHTNIK